jgi:hypothetical protein
MGTQVELVQVGGGKRVSAAAVDDGDAAASSSTAGGSATLEQQLRYLTLISASESISVSFASTHDASAAALLLLKAHRDAAAAACSLPPSSASAAADLKEMIDGTRSSYNLPNISHTFFFSSATPNLSPPAGEVIALESILGHSFTAPSLASPHAFHIATSIPRIGSMTIVIDTSPSFAYPYQPPLITVVCPKLKQHERVFLSIKSACVVFAVDSCCGAWRDFPSSFSDEPLRISSGPGASHACTRVEIKCCSMMLSCVSH